MKFRNAWVVVAALAAVAPPALAQELMPEAVAAVERVGLSDRDRDLIVRRIDEEVAKLPPDEREATRRRLLDQLAEVERQSEATVARALIAERSHSSPGGVLEAAASVVLGPKVAVRQAEAILRSGTFAAWVARTMRQADIKSAIPRAITLPPDSASTTPLADEEEGLREAPGETTP